MKSPDEIKKGLERCSSISNCADGCPYHVTVEGSFGCEEMGCEDGLLPDALALIHQLEAQVPRWISVEEGLPENDVPVLVSAKRKNWDGKEYRIVFTAFHTDGTTHTEDSGYGWDYGNLGMQYCEETDDYIIPEAWWEDVRYGEEFSKVYDTTVTHWMPLPEPPKED